MKLTVSKSKNSASFYVQKSIRKKDGGTYKNSRNAVAGIMGLKDIGPMLVQHAKLTLVDPPEFCEMPTNAVVVSCLAQRCK